MDKFVWATPLFRMYGKSSQTRISVYTNVYTPHIQKKTALPDLVELSFAGKTPYFGRSGKTPSSLPAKAGNIFQSTQNL